MDSKVAQKFTRDNNYSNINYVYNVKWNDDVNHRGMKLRWNNEVFSSLNVVNWKPAPYGSKGVIKQYNYRSDTRLGPGIVSIRIIPCSCHVCTTKLSLPWGSTIKEACNQPIYGRVYNCKYSLIIGSHNNCIIMNFLDIGTDNVEYEYINITIFDGNVMNISLIITKGNYGAIDAKYT